MNKSHFSKTCFTAKNQQIKMALKPEVFLRDFNWADEGQHRTNCEIDVIIGSDLYWQVVTGDIERDNRSGFDVINIVFVWSLSGSFGNERASNNNCDVGLVYSTQILRICRETNDKTILRLEKHRNKRE